MAPSVAKEAARPRYLHGAWGTFASAFEAAVQRSLAVLAAAGQVLDSDDRDVDAAILALAVQLPTGTIDPQGETLDLDQPFVI